MNTKTSLKRKKPYYKAISREIEEYIKREKPSMLPTEHQFMEKYKVSRTTIRKALGLLKEANTIESVKGRGTAVSKKIKRVSEMNFLLILPEYSRFQHYQRDIFAKLQDFLGKKGAGINVMVAAGQCELNSRQKQWLEKADGIFAGASAIRAAGWSSLLQLYYHKTLILLNFDPVNFKFVYCDKAQGTAIATKHLLGLGHRKIATIGLVIDSLRLSVFESVMEQNNVNHDSSLDINCAGFHHAGYIAAGELVEKNIDFTAVVAQNDICALGVMERLLQMGYKIPEDVSIIGYDNLLDSESYPVPLTTVGPNLDRVVDSAIALILDENHKFMDDTLYGKVIEPELIERESTGPAPR